MDIEHNNDDIQKDIGRTTPDLIHSFATSKLFIVGLIAIIIILLIYFTWDILTLIPLYVFSSIILSWAWYNPICRWLAHDSIFIDVVDPRDNLITTWRLGKQVFSEIGLDGMTNVQYSLSGNMRIIASDFDYENLRLINSWIHDHSPFDFFRDKGTLVRFSSLLNEVFDDIIDGKAVAQIEGRKHAMQTMNRHYQDLDSVFFGDLTNEGGDDDYDNEQQDMVSTEAS